MIPDQGVFRYKDEKLYFYEVTNKEHFKTEAPDCILVRLMVMSGWYMGGRTFSI